MARPRFPVSGFGRVSALDRREADLFFAELTGQRAVVTARSRLPRERADTGLPADGGGYRGAIDLPHGSPDRPGAPAPRSPFEGLDEAEGLPADDEEGYWEDAAETDDPDPAPNGAAAPFAPILTGILHWPVTTGHRSGRTVSFRSTGGAWSGNAARGFGADRSNRTRFHIGVDLFGNYGDPVLAIADGRVVAFFPFCCGENRTSWALLVDHGQCVVNYGEVAPDSLRANGLAIGAAVTGGQRIARVGRNPGGSSMIHFETYAPGTTRTDRWLKGQARPPRVLNPTRLLLQLRDEGLPRPSSNTTSAPVRTPAAESFAPRIALETEPERSDQDWYTEDDFAPIEQTPARTWQRCPGRSADDARWADDRVSPDYRHLGVAGVSQAFDFTARHLDRLCRANRFDVTAGQDEVLFGLRGCRLVGSGDQGAFSSTVRLSEDLPDHFHYRCVLGIWKRSTGTLAVFPGSTVPNWGYMCVQATGGGREANLLPTGRYLYNVGRHRSVDGAFILGREVVVVRSNDDLIFETTDLWERWSPADNIHPGFNPTFAEFSSAGCQTVRGNFANGKHSGPWATFRVRAGLDPSDSRARERTRFVYVLLTGRDARLAATGHSAPLDRLRFGSQGPDVQALQMELGRRRLFSGAAGGIMDPATTMAYIGWQQARDGGAADAIVTPVLGRELGFDMIRQQSVAPTASGSGR